MFRKIVYSLVGIHFTIITLAIVGVLNFEKLYRHAEIPMAILTSLNYSAWRFAFFTPDVGKSTEVDILLENTQGKKIHYSTSKGFKFLTHNQESANRFYGYKVNTARDTLFMDLSARSACTYLLNEHRDMNRISFTMRWIFYPDMIDYRKGAKIQKETFYETTFGL